MYSGFVTGIGRLLALIFSILCLTQAAADTLTVMPRGNSVFSVTVYNAISSGHTAEGRAYVVIPQQGAIVTAMTPGGHSADPTAVRSGAQLNPKVGQKQGYDSRDTHRFDPKRGVELPLKVAPGDILVLTNSVPAGELSRQERRFGLFQQGDGSTAVWFTDTQPILTRGAPAPIGWPGRGTPKQAPAFDATAAAKNLPSYPSVRIHRYFPSFDDVIAAIDQEAFLLAQQPGTTAGSGYEAILPQGYSGATRTNYGRYVASAWGAAGLLMISDRITVDKKAQLLQRAFITGHDWYESLKGEGYVIGGNGGHHQFFFIPTLVYLLYSNQNPADMAKYLPGNILSQPFFVSRSQMRDLRRHNSETAPYTFRERSIVSVEGAFVTLSKTNSDAAQTGFHGLILTDGTNRGQVLEERRYTLELDSAQGFAPGQTVWLESPYPINAGDVNWLIRERNDVAPKGWRTFNPSHVAFYRSLNFWSEALLFGAAVLGPDWPKEFDAFRAYVIMANDPNLPVGYDFPSHFQKFDRYPISAKFWNVHWRRILEP